MTSHMVGGVLVTKVKVRSGWIVIVTGVGVPGVRPAVRAVVCGSTEWVRAGSASERVQCGRRTDR